MYVFTGQNAGNVSISTEMPLPTSTTTAGSNTRSTHAGSTQRSSTLTSTLGPPYAQTANPQSKSSISQLPQPDTGPQDIGKNAIKDGSSAREKTSTEDKAKNPDKTGDKVDDTAGINNKLLLRTVIDTGQTEERKDADESDDRRNGEKGEKSPMGGDRADSGGTNKLNDLEDDLIKDKSQKEMNTTISVDDEEVKDIDSDSDERNNTELVANKDNIKVTKQEASITEGDTLQKDGRNKSDLNNHHNEENELANKIEQPLRTSKILDSILPRVICNTNNTDNNTDCANTGQEASNSSTEDVENTEWSRSYEGHDTSDSVQKTAQEEGTWTDNGTAMATDKDSLQDTDDHDFLQGMTIIAFISAPVFP